jgi:hypothetical protein
VEQRAVGSGGDDFAADRGGEAGGEVAGAADQAHVGTAPGGFDGLGHDRLAGDESPAGEGEESKGSVLGTDPWDRSLGPILGTDPDYCTNWEGCF